MPIKLKELDRFLTTGKMKFERSDEVRHVGYVVRLEGRRLGLPTLLRVSHGSGEADLGNLKGVAVALGLNVRELEVAESCRLRRECVLTALAVHLLQFALQRHALIRDKQAGLEGVEAMVESVQSIIQVLESAGNITWNAAELKAFKRIRPNVEKLGDDPLVAIPAKALLASISQTLDEP